jgi:glycerol-3-phosphate dehydrogenase
MAKDVVDMAERELPKRVQPSITDKVPLLGAEGYFAMRNQIDTLAAEYGLHPHRIRHVLDRYGSMIRDVLDPGLSDPGLLGTLPGAEDYLLAEIRYAVTHEGARHMEDVLLRRTRISIEYPHRGVECAEQVADIMAFVLGWSPDVRDAEVTAYRARIEAERASQALPDDASADQARTAVPDVRPRLRPDESVP